MDQDLEKCKSDLNAQKIYYKDILSKQQLSVGNINLFSKALSEVENEKKFVNHWRYEWDAQLKLAEEKFQMEKSLLLTKLYELGYVYDEETHQFSKAKKDEEEEEYMKGELELYNDYLKSHTANMKSWSLKNLMKYRTCYEEVWREGENLEIQSINNVKENEVYRSIFNPKEMWRNEVQSCNESNESRRVICGLIRQYMIDGGSKEYRSF